MATICIVKIYYNIKHAIEFTSCLQNLTFNLFAEVTYFLY